jgi:transposase
MTTWFADGVMQLFPQATIVALDSTLSKWLAGSTDRVGNKKETRNEDQKREWKRERSGDRDSLESERERERSGDRESLKDSIEMYI